MPRRKAEPSLGRVSALYRPYLCREVGIPHGPIPAACRAGLEVRPPVVRRAGVARPDGGTGMRKIFRTFVLESKRENHGQVYQSIHGRGLQADIRAGGQQGFVD